MWWLKILMDVRKKERGGVRKYYFITSRMRPHKFRKFVQSAHITFLMSRSAFALELDENVAHYERRSRVEEFGPNPTASSALVEGGGFQTDRLKGARGCIRVRCYPAARACERVLFLRAVCPDHARRRVSSCV